MRIDRREELLENYIPDTGWVKDIPEEDLGFVLALTRRELRRRKEMSIEERILWSQSAADIRAYRACLAGIKHVCMHCGRGVNFRCLRCDNCRRRKHADTTNAAYQQRKRRREETMSEPAMAGIREARSNLKFKHQTKRGTNQ